MTRELEEHIREDPTDEARWLVLEDWLLERGDKRAELVTAEKAFDRAAAGTLRNRLRGALYGKGGTGLAKVASSGAWRAGFARDVCLDLRDRANEAEEIAALFAKAPAFALVSKLHVDLPRKVDDAAVLRRLGDGAFASGVRELWIRYPHGRTGRLDGALLAPFTRLVKAMLPHRAVEYAPNLDRLPKLELIPHAEEEVRSLLQPGRFRELRWLALDCQVFTSPLTDLFAPLIAGTCAPQLETLWTVHADPGALQAVAAAARFAVR